MAALQGEILNTNVNHTYVLFSSEQAAIEISPIIEREFERQGVNVTDFEYKGKSGLIINEAVNAATLKTLDFDPMTIDKLIDMGFHIVARFSDRITTI